MNPTIAAGTDHEQLNTRQQQPTCELSNLLCGASILILQQHKHGVTDQQVAAVFLR